MMPSGKKYLPVLDRPEVAFLTATQKKKLSDALTELGFVNPKLVVLRLKQDLFTNIRTVYLNTFGQSAENRQRAGKLVEAYQRASLEVDDGPEAAEAPEPDAESPAIKKSTD